MTPSKILYLLPKAGLVALLAWSAACGGPASPPAEEAAPAAGPRRGGTVVIGFTGDISGVNVLASGSSSLPTTETTQQLFIGLLDEQPDFQDNPPSFEPRLAESWEFSEDHEVLTFHLRQDVVWSDGVPLTAEDVRWTWEAQTSPEVHWDNSSMKSSITDVEVVDPYTVRFHFTHAYPGQLVHANEGVILPKHVWSQLPFDQWHSHGPWFVEHLVVSGPFTLESWKPQQEIVLRRNDLYYEKGKPYLDRVILRIIPDASSQMTQLLGGDVDFVRQIPAAMAEKIAENPRTRLVTFWPSQFTTLIWNLRNPLFESVDVRRAMTFGIDRQTIVDTIWNGYARTSASPYISSVWGHNPAIKPLPYDPEAARKLLAGQGWTDSDGDGVLDRDGTPFRFDLLVNAGNQERVDAAVMIQAQLRRIGVQAQPLTLDWNTIGDMLDRREFDATITGLSVETSLDLSPYFHSDSIDLRLNLGSYSNPEVDKLLEQARAQLDLEDSKPYLFRIQEIFEEEQPQTILWEPQRVIGLSRRIQDAHPTAIGTLQNIQDWWVLPER